MTRDLPAELGDSSDFGLDYRNPVLSDALAVHPEQVAQHRAAHPDIPILDDGRVVLKSHRDRQRILKKLGFHDRDGYT